MPKASEINSYRLISFNKFIERTSKHPQEITIYRGVTHQAYDLRPKVGRLSLKIWRNDIPIDVEQRMLRRFQERAVFHLNPRPTDEWEWLTIAQHHGLPTRLLDWSRNPLVAAFFAVEREIQKWELRKHSGEFSGDSAVYVFRGKTVISRGNLSRMNKKYLAGPFKITKTEKFVPAHLDSRIVAQLGVFTIHHDPVEPYPLELKDIDKLIIPFAQRITWKKQLHRLGINRASLFPNLDNLSKYIEWDNTKSTS